MQLGGISGNHSTDSHQVTNCMHEHTHIKQGASAASGMSAKALQIQQQKQEAQLSLTDWARKLLGGGKSFWKGFWGSGSAASLSAEESGDKAGQQVVMQLGEETLKDADKTLSKSIIPEMNPYFQTLPDNSPATGMPLVQRIRTKIKGVAGQLAGKLPGRFFRFQAKNSFQARSEKKPEENLRRRSKYRKDELEINCILTDESYLLDSYDRKGEYSQLTTKK